MISTDDATRFASGNDNIPSQAEKPKIESSESYEQLASTRIDELPQKASSISRLMAGFAPRVRPVVIPDWEPENPSGVEAEEIFMPYALFTNGEQISKAYGSREEVWKKAEEAGLVVDLPSEEEKKKPKQVLDEGYHIQSCPPDQATEVPSPASMGTVEPAVRKRSSSGR